MDKKKEREEEVKVLFLTVRHESDGRDVPVLRTTQSIFPSPDLTPCTFLHTGIEGMPGLSASELLLSVYPGGNISFVDFPEQLLLVSF